MSEDQADAARERDLEAFIAHARWLVDYHNKRSDQLGTRAVALLGFSGVIIVLLTRGVDLAVQLEPNFGLWAALGVTLAALVATAVLALLTITTREVVAPSVVQTRDRWARYVSGARRGTALADIAETYLNSTDLEGASPLSSAKSEADDRAARFRWALRALLVALLGVVALIVQAYLQWWEVKS